MERLRITPMREARERIRAYMRSNALGPGERLPSERVLSEDWGLSRGTVRSAIRAGEHDGLLERRPGSGTYVARPTVERNLQDLRPLADVAEATGYQVVTEILRLTVIEANLERADQLDVRLGEELYSLLRRRVFDGVPAVVEYSLIPVAVAPGLSKEDLEKQSLYSLLEERYGNRIAEGYESLSLLPCPQEAAELLSIEEGQDVFVQNGVALSPERSPIESFESVSLGQYVSFVSDLRAR